jgi:hypothetical protein
MLRRLFALHVSERRPFLEGPGCPFLVPPPLDRREEQTIGAAVEVPFELHRPGSHLEVVVVRHADSVTTTCDY